MKSSKDNVSLITEIVKSVAIGLAKPAKLRYEFKYISVCKPAHYDGKSVSIYCFFNLSLIREYRKLQARLLQ
jgi:hypothetical protein